MGNGRRAFTLLMVVFFSVSSAGCYQGPRLPLNPPRLVTDSETDMAVQLFMQATLFLAQYHGYETITYAEISSRSEKAGFRMLPLMPPNSVRATPALINFPRNIPEMRANIDATKAFRMSVDNTWGYKALLGNYIKTGWKASQIICRNYLLQLEENNRYLQFLQDEFGVLYTLASGILAIADVNKTLLKVLPLTRTGVDGFIDKYQEYRFLNVDVDATLSLVEAAQNNYAKHYFDQLESSVLLVDVRAGTKSIPSLFSFAEAIDAVNRIEYQCTRGQIRNLLNRAVNNSPTNLFIDPVSGAIGFKSAAKAAEKENGSSSSAVQNAAASAKSGANAAQNAAAAAANAANEAKNAAAAAQSSAAAAKRPNGAQ